MDACVCALSSVPRLLRMLLQSLRPADLCEEELPQLGHILTLLLQHAPMRSHLLANVAPLQHVLQELMVNSLSLSVTLSVSLSVSLSRSLQCL